MQYHHIVEQSEAQVKKSGADVIHSVENIVAIPKEVHQEITAYHATRQDLTGALTVHQWLRLSPMRSARIRSREGAWIFG